VIAPGRSPLLSFPTLSKVEGEDLLLGSLYPARLQNRKIYFKKVENFRPPKVSSKHHDLPRNSPQRHHGLPSKNTTKNAKPPVKTTLHHKNIFSDSQPENPSG
jgi:hypothetical protein